MESKMSYEVLPIDQDGGIAREFKCPICEAELRGILVCGRCPDCETPLSKSVVGRAVCKVDDENHVAENTKCRKCGYELIGLDPYGNCPECGSPIGFSLEVDLLRYANIDWLKRIKGGFTVYLISMAVAVVMIIISIVISIVIKDLAVRAMVTMGITIVMAFFTLIATWFITWPYASDHPEMEIGHSLRTAVRIVLVFSMMSQIGGAILAIHPAIGLYAQLPTQILAVALNILFMLYLQRLAMFIPDERLAAHTKIVMYGLAIVGIIATAATVLAIASGINPAALQSTGGGGGAAPTMSVPMLAMIGMGCVAGLSGLVFMVWMIILIFKYRNRFARAVRLAAWTSSADRAL